MAPLDQPFNGRARSHKHGLDPPVRQVTNPSPNALAQGEPSCAVTKVYTLHEAADEHMRLDTLWGITRRGAHRYGLPSESRLSCSYCYLRQEGMLQHLVHVCDEQNLQIVTHLPGYLFELALVLPGKNNRSQAGAVCG